MDVRIDDAFGLEVALKSKQLVTGAPGTYVVVLDTGDEVVEQLKRFAERSAVGTASITAIGGFSTATLAYFDIDSKQYQDIPVDEQVEVLSLSGVVAAGGEEPQLHMHAVLGRRDGSTRGGHLKAGHVRPTLEVMVTESPPHVVRHHDPASGLSLIDLDAWQTGRAS